MTKGSWSSVRQLVYQRAQGCCEYCQACEDNTGQPMHIEHIDPKGGNNPANLCLSCSSCNLSKGIVTAYPDPETNIVVALFNPRQQIWAEHFMWLDDGLHLYGKTPTGRATIGRLKLNRERLIRARGNWIAAGNHPPNL